MAAHHVNPKQLQMFMTPKEIHATYQALDGDRESGERLTHNARGTYGTRDTGNSWDYPGSGTHVKYGSETDDELYARKSQEAQLPPGEYHELHHGEVPEAPGYDTLGGRSSAPRPRGSGSSAMDSYDMKMGSYADRKVSEHYDRMDYGESLYDSIARTGVQAPVHLGQQFGSMDKPMVVGGHHRLAVQTELNPNQPIPVMHHHSIFDARQSGVYT